MDDGKGIKMDKGCRPEKEIALGLFSFEGEKSSILHRACVPADLRGGSFCGWIRRLESPFTLRTLTYDRHYVSQEIESRWPGKYYGPILLEEQIFSCS